MDTKAKKPAMKVVMDLYDYHTKLFKNALVDIAEKDAANRLGTKANHVAWIAGSLVFQRYQIAKFSGIEQKQETGALFEKDWSLQESETYPTLDAYKKDWDKVSGPLRTALEKLTEEQLNGPEPFGMPGENLVFFDALTFWAEREAYCLGQLALYRRLLGYDAIKYD